MFKTISAFAVATLLCAPAFATPERKIVNPDEIMILVPGLEALGYSRLSTVEFCAEQTNTDYTDLQTDSDFENMERCLIEQT